MVITNFLTVEWVISLQLIIAHIFLFIPIDGPIDVPIDAPPVWESHKKIPELILDIRNVLFWKKCNIKNLVAIYVVNYSYYYRDGMKGLYQITFKYDPSSIKLMRISPTMFPMNTYGDILIRNDDNWFPTYATNLIENESNFTNKQYELYLFRMKLVYGISDNLRKEKGYKGTNFSFNEC